MILLRHGQSTWNEANLFTGWYDADLTDKGRASWDVLAAMWRYGMDWQWTEDDPPLRLVDRETGDEVVPVVVDQATGERLDIRKVRLTLRA